jgi:hypothetical protein
MTTTQSQIYTVEYTPTKLVINNFGINIENETTEKLDLSEYLIVGENTDQTMSMIVDSRGFAANAKFLERRKQTYYNNEIYGNTLLKGDIHVVGNIFLNGTSINNSGGGSSSNSFSSGNIFNYSYNNRGIYYNGSTTFGSYDSSSNNSNTVQIVKAVNRNIDNSQFAIKNNKNAVARMGIIGESGDSPLIFNTSSNVPIEFHVGRGQDFFQKVYTKTVYENGQGNPKTSDVPIYTDRLNSPHFSIDINGNVGIKTDYSRLFRFNVRGFDSYGAAVYNSQIAHPDLFVNGTTFSSNILMFDYETNTHKNLDELYSRRDGQSLVLANLSPGKFARGFFEFQSNISIMGNIDRASSLMVYGDTSNTGDLRIDGNVDVKNTVTTRTLDVEEQAIVHNNLFIQDNIYVKANIYKYIGTSNNEDKYQMLSTNNNVQPDSNLVYFGSGFSTKGRFGVGIDTHRGDQVNNQLVVTKNDKSIFELELTDNSYLGFIKTAFIGHAKTDNEHASDGSLIFVTPSSNNLVYHQMQRSAKQNIYFYPGYEEAISTFRINSNSPPTLGIFVDHKVGVKTFHPTHDFDVNGDVAITGNYYIKRPNKPDVKMGIWNDATFSNNEKYGGIFYYNEASPRVGINTAPYEEYGLTVSGKLISTDGYYTEDGFKIITLYSSGEALTKPKSEYQYAYLNGRFAIGDLGSTGTLSIRENYPELNTSLKLLNSTSGNESTLHFVGNKHEYIQRMDDIEGTFEIFNGPLNDRALIAKIYSTGSNQLILNSNLAYGIEKHNSALVVNGNVDIKGDLNITGRYKISSREIEISAGETAGYYKAPDTSENVYITGDSIQLNTNTSKYGALYIGWKNNVPTTNDLKNALINAVMPSDNPQMSFITKYSSPGETILSQYKSGGFSALIGIVGNKFFIGGDITSPYITVGNIGGFSTLANYTTTGIGTTAPNGSRLHVYTQINTQPLSTFTRYDSSASDNEGIFADISLEKKLRQYSYKWNIHAPVLGDNNQKLQFLYQDTFNPAYNILTEKVCITKDGCVGINTPSPKYGLDITGGGLASSIRLCQMTDTRQSLVFQSGENDYGSDMRTDYSIYTFRNTFCIESRDVMRSALQIMHVGSNNNIGLNQIANEKYSVSIGGSLNVTDELYVNDRRIFSATQNSGENASYFEWTNILINPEGENYGGVSINGGHTTTSNIFQVNAGMNGNVTVFNSVYPQSFVHFRNKHLHPELNSMEEHIWRSGSSNNSFIVEHRSNVPYGELLITDKPDNYARVIEYIQTPIAGEFIQRLNGSIDLTAINPRLVMNGQSVFGTSNDHMYITTSNLGIGTSAPLAKIHIKNDDQVGTLNIRQMNTSCNIVDINMDKFVITHSGNVGIGTSVPQAKMHIIGSTKFESSLFDVTGDSIFRNNVTVKGNVVNDSDYRIKSDVRVIENALSKIKKISGYTFIKNGVSQRETGVIAQEINEVLPEAVYEHTDGLLGVAYGNLIGLLIEGIKELSDKLDDIHLKIG